MDAGDVGQDPPERVQNGRPAADAEDEQMVGGHAGDDVVELGVLEYGQELGDEDVLVLRQKV